MKKIFFYSLIILMILGCAGRQSSTQKTKKTTETSQQEDLKTSEKVSTKTDSSGSKKTTEQGQSTSKTNSSGWKYTAPTSNPCNDTGLILPVYIKTPSGDSIDISRLPQGSILESKNESSESEYMYQRAIDEQSKIINDLRKDLEEERSRKIKDKIVEVEKLKEVEKQTVQWYLVGAALILGTFLPSILKGLFNLIKKSIKPI